MDVRNDTTRNVIIFKGDDESNSDRDPYVVELSKIFFNVKLIPALKFEFHNLELLKDRLSCSEKFSGIILSSPRCVQAVEKSASLLKWSNHKVFVVGSKTSCLAKDLGVKPLGEDCGNASSLAEFILRDYSYLELPLLIPHGNLSLKTLTNVLTEGGMKVDCVEVYKTVQNPRLEDLIKDHYDKCSNVDFVVFMSPSAVKSCLPLIEKHQSLSTVKFVALGPSTASALESCDITPAAVAEKPSPEHLVEAISQFIADKKET